MSYKNKTLTFTPTGKTITGKWDNLGERIHKSQKDYTRKIKHKKVVIDD